MADRVARESGLQKLSDAENRALNERLAALGIKSDSTICALQISLLGVRHDGLG